MIELRAGTWSVMCTEAVRALYNTNYRARTNYKVDGTHDRRFYRIRLELLSPRRDRDVHECIYGDWIHP